jgi:hypothetical protein
VLPGHTACLAIEMMMAGWYRRSSALLSELTILSPRMSHSVIADLVTVRFGPLLAPDLPRLSSGTRRLVHAEDRLVDRTGMNESAHAHNFPRVGTEPLGSCLDNRRREGCAAT